MLDDKKKNQLIQINPYQIFAKYYDHFMKHVPYQKWVNYLHAQANSILGHKPASIVDLGCGTGRMLFYFDKMFDKNRIKLTGIDSSIEMIQIAQKNHAEMKNWIHSSIIQGIPLPDSCTDFAYSSHDSLNYLLEEKELLSHFQEIKRLLKPSGLYSADFVTLNNIKLHYDKKNQNHKLPGSTLNWKNTYNSKTSILESALTFCDTNNRQSHQEIHYQKFYNKQDIEKSSKQAGLRIVLIEGDYNKRKPKNNDSFWNYHFQAI